MGGGLLGVFALGALSGCIIYVEDPPTARRYGPPAPTVIVEDATVGSDDYIYYPDYEVYYALNRREYYCLEGNAWVWRSSPWGISGDWLRRSPGVRMDFHDRPEHHHPRVAQQYPRTHRHDGDDSAHQSGRNDGQHDTRSDRPDEQRTDWRDNRRNVPPVEGRGLQPGEDRNSPPTEVRGVQPGERYHSRPNGGVEGRATENPHGDESRVGRPEPRPQPTPQASKPEPKSGEEKAEKVRDPREEPRAIDR